MHYIETLNLILRDWSEADLPAFVRLNGDEQVMEFFLKKLTPQESSGFYDRIRAEFVSCGFGEYAVEEKCSGAFIGFVGLHNVSLEMEFAPAVEISWRLLPEYWGRGYAAEAAAGCLKYAGNELGIDRVFAFTSLMNKRSERVMQKIGMVRIGEFDHPDVPPDHPLCRHILYRTPE